MSNGRQRIALVCSPGGHLDELIHIAKSLSHHDLFFMTYRTPRTAHMKLGYLLPNILQSRLAFIFSFFRILAIFVRERPEVIVSTGAEIALPAFFIGKLLRCSLIFVESLCRVTSPSGTGRILYHISDLLIVQWPQLVRVYGERATYIGGFA